MKSLVYIVMLLVITGCCYSSSDLVYELDEAQLIMNDDPAKALEKLNQYDMSEIQDSALMARWALLYSEAMVANHLTAPTDTIINIAINYYGFHNVHNELNKALKLKTQLSNANAETNALATALYLQKEKEFMVYKERTKRQQLMFIAIIVVLIGAGVIIWQRQRLKIKDTQNESLMAEVASLNNDLSLQQSEYSSLNDKMSNLLVDRFKVIDELCETYYESQGTKTEKKAIVDKVKSQIEALKSDEGIFAEMEKCQEDLLRRLREEIPQLKPEEYRLMVYLASGLSNRTIALLIGESINVAYKRKSRLKAKITDSDTPHKADFLAQF